jgi:multiple antibiotic resistance protein
MVNRDPLPTWSSGRITLLGDAAHPMYPGSNGASQAIVDTRVLARERALQPSIEEAIAAYDTERRPQTADVVLANRQGGPERVIDLVEQRTPQGFFDLDVVITREELEEIARHYKRTAVDPEALNNRPSLGVAPATSDGGRTHSDGHIVSTSELEPQCRQPSCTTVDVSRPPMTRVSVDGPIWSYRGGHRAVAEISPQFPAAGRGARRRDTSPGTCYVVIVAAWARGDPRCWNSWPATGQGDLVTHHSAPGPGAGCCSGASRAGGVTNWEARVSPLWIEYLRFPLTLFTILTPIAAIPVYMNLTNGQRRSERARVSRAAVLTVFVVLSCAALAGDVILRVFGSSLDAFRVGGGIALLLIGLSKLAGGVTPGGRGRSDVVATGRRAALSVVPLGMPLLAGPGAISTVIVQTQGGEGLGHLGVVLASIVLVCALVWGTLALAPAIERRLGSAGLTVVDRVVGLLLAAVAVDLIATGLRALFPGLA